jgi:hypothetical protein
LSRPGLRSSGDIKACGRRQRARLATIKVLDAEFTVELEPGAQFLTQRIVHETVKVAQGSLSSPAAFQGRTDRRRPGAVAAHADNR